jgi:hypothetical protein
MTAAVFLAVIAAFLPTSGASAAPTTPGRPVSAGFAGRAIPMYAEGYTWFGSRSVAGHFIPGGYMDHTTDGSGLRVDDEKVNFEVANSICNWRVDLSFQDTNNVQYIAFPGAVHQNCTPVGGILWYNHWLIYMRPGRVCASLYTNGTRLVTGCNSIHK